MHNLALLPTSTLNNIKKHWHLFWKFRQLQLVRMMENRRSFFFWAFVSIMWTFFNAFFFVMLTQVNNGLGGWSLHEMYVLIGIFTMYDGVVWMFFYHNMANYTHSIFSGELDGFLVKPVDLQAVMMTTKSSYNNFFRFIAGPAMIIYGLTQLGITPSVVEIFVFILLMLLGLTLIYTLWFALATTAFYFDKLENINEVMPALRRVWEVPRGVITGVSSFIFSTVVPILLATNIPAEFILGKASWEWLVYFVGLCGVMVMGSRWFFIRSVKKYAGVGS